MSTPKITAEELAAVAEGTLHEWLGPYESLAIGQPEEREIAVRRLTSEPGTVELLTQERDGDGSWDLASERRWKLTLKIEEVVTP